MLTVIGNDILKITQILLIPGFILLVKWNRRTNDMQRDVKDLRRYIILLCEKMGVDCPTLKDEK